MYFLRSAPLRKGMFRTPSRTLMALLKGMRISLHSTMSSPVAGSLWQTMCITLLVSEATVFSAVVVETVGEEEGGEEGEDEEEVKQEQKQGDIGRRNAWTRSCDSPLLMSWRVWARSCD